MDTPKKTQITTSLSKFEDSPVFNYINSLSPIKPVKSIHITQTFQSLSFSSLPSIFTSPHVSSHKESRFLRRHNCTDSSKPETLSENGNEFSSHDEEVHNKSSELQENINSGESMVVSNENSSDVKFVIELPQQLKYDSGSPDNDITECDWENLVPDASELILNSPIEPQSFKWPMEKPVDPFAYFSASVNKAHEMQVDAISSTEQLEVEDLSTQHGETIEPEEINQTNLVVNEAMLHMQLQAVSGLHRGMRRRCLDFETVGARGKNLGDASTSSTSTCMERQSNEKFASKDKQLVPVKPGIDSLRCVLPGIGLHLNALARTSTDSMNVKLNSLSYGRNSSFVASFRSPTNSEELDESLTLAPETDLDPTESSVPFDVSQLSACLVSEENSHNSPKKKRQKLEGECEACKHCNCKKSKCLKLYCECFAAGVYCVEPCLCQDCLNKPIHEDTVLATRKQIESRNPLAFAPKVIRNSEPVTEIGDEPTKTPASARHKRGCNCKKSSCLKKYCECYQEGVGCSINCRCEGCRNAFGRKDGSVAETVPEEETEGDENNGEIKRTTEIRNYEEQNPNSALPETPLPLCRPKLHLPFSSKSKPPRSCLGGRTSSGFYNGQTYPKHNILRPQQKFEQQSKMVSNDDVPEIFRGNCTPGTGTKTSPNGKRVSPPHGISGSSPGFQSGRKLILQSIPSFPSLTPQH